MSNYLNHLVAGSLNQLDTVQPFVRSMFEPPPESADLVEDADWNWEQLAVTAFVEETEMAMEWETQLSTVALIEELLDWQTPASYLYTADELDYPPPTDFTSNPAEYLGQESALTAQGRNPIEEGRSTKAEGFMFRSDEDSVPPELEPLNGGSVGVLNPCSLQLRAEDKSQNSLLPSASCPLPFPDNWEPSVGQENRVAESSSKLPIEIHQVVSSSEPLDVMSVPPSLIQPHSQPAVSPSTPDRQRLTSAIARTTNPVLLHPDTQQPEMSAPKSSPHQPIETHQVVSSLGQPEVVKLQPSTCVQQPEVERQTGQMPRESATLQPTTDIAPSPISNRQRLTSAIAQTTNSVPLHPGTQQPEMSAPKSSPQQPVETHRFVSSLGQPEVVKLQPSTPVQQPEAERQTIQMQRESAMLQPTTNIAPSPTPNRQRLTSAIAQTTNSVPLHPGTQQPEMSAPKSSPQQPVGTYRVTSSLRLPEVEKQTVTDRMRSLVERQPLKLAVETQTQAIPARSSAAPQTQPVPESAKNQTIETQQRISSERSRNGVRSQLSPTQRQPESAITQPAIDVAPSPIPNRQLLRSAIAREPNATRFNPTVEPQRQQPYDYSQQQPVETDRVVSSRRLPDVGNRQPSTIQRQPSTDIASAPTSNPVPLRSAIAREPNVPHSNPVAEQHRQLAPEPSATQGIAINRVASTPPPATAPFPEPSFVTRNPTVPTNSRAQLLATPAQEPTRSDTARVAASAPTPTERASTPARVVQPRVNVSAPKGNGAAGTENVRFSVKSSSPGEQERHSWESTEAEVAWLGRTPEIVPLSEPFNQATDWESPRTSGDTRETQQQESSSDLAAPQTVQVNIGRVEIRATQPAAPPRPKPYPAPAVMSLDEYLRRRSRRGQR